MSRAMVEASNRRLGYKIETAGLPSGESAQALVRGEAGALPLVILHWGLRAILIGSAIAAFTPLRGAMLLKAALAGSSGIEAFVLGWAFIENGGKK